MAKDVDEFAARWYYYWRRLPMARMSEGAVERRRVRHSPSRPWRLAMTITRSRPEFAFSPLALIYMFLVLIIVGALVLRLPVSSADNHATRLVDALFTSASAVCVTGLVVVDTGTHWSTFGQAVILVLIQVGGFGFMTSASLLLLVFGRRVGLRERLLTGETIGLAGSGGVVTLVKRMAVFTFVAEAAGTLVLLPRLSGAGGAWKALFQSVSAFNNAGFDLFGNFESLTVLRQDGLLVSVTGVLLVVGGLSYVVLADVAVRRLFHPLAADTKFVLVGSAALLGAGFLVLLAAEAGNPATLGPLDWPQKVLCALFQSATPRTAGFTTIRVGEMREYALLFTMFLMFVGGATGSTAGGVKVNTVGVLAATVRSILRGDEHPRAFGREYETHTVYRAMAVAMLSAVFVGSVSLLLAALEGGSLTDMAFESMSAFGTVGLSTGVTPSLSVAGKLLIAFTMFVGRLGPLYVALALVQRQRTRAFHYPVAAVRIG
jgi:trk system potassium uptake protein TrkH